MTLIALTQRWTVPAGGGVADAAYYSYDLDGNLEVIKELPGGSLTYFEHGSHGLVTKIKPLGAHATTCTRTTGARPTRSPNE